MIDVEKFKEGVLALTERMRETEQNEPGYDVYDHEDPDICDLEEYIKNGNIEEDVELVQVLDKIFEDTEQDNDDEEW